MIWTLCQWLKIILAFQFRFMAIAVNAIYGHDPSIEMHPQLEPKKTKGTLYWLCK